MTEANQRVSAEIVSNFLHDFEWCNVLLVCNNDSTSSLKQGWSVFSHTPLFTLAHIQTTEHNIYVAMPHWAQHFDDVK